MLRLDVRDCHVLMGRELSQHVCHLDNKYGQSYRYIAADVNVTFKLRVYAVGPRFTSEC